MREKRVKATISLAAKLILSVCFVCFAVVLRNSYLSLDDLKSSPSPVQSISDEKVKELAIQRLCTCTYESINEMIWSHRAKSLDNDLVDGSKENTETLLSSGVRQFDIDVSLSPVSSVSNTSIRPFVVAHPTVLQSATSGDSKYPNRSDLRPLSEFLHQIHEHAIGMTTHVNSAVKPSVEVRRYVYPLFPYIPFIPFYTLLYPSIPFYTLIYPSIPFYTLLYPSIPFYTLLYPSIPSIPLCTLYTPLYPSIPFYTLLYPSIPFYTLLYPLYTLYLTPTLIYHL